MHFAGEGVSSGMVYAEMSVLVKNERAKITFDFGTEEDAKELRKEALWDKELQKETEFKSTNGRNPKSACATWRCQKD